MTTQDATLTELVATPVPDELDEDDFAPPPARGKVGKLTATLGVLVVLALGFLGGILVQKNEAGTTGGAALAARAGRARGAGGAGGFAGFGEGAGGFGAGTGAAGAGAGAAAGTGGAAGATGSGTAAAPTAGPVAIGTVVSVTGNTLVVKDLGGTTHTLTLGSGVTLSTSTPLTAGSLKPGQAVTVDGTTAAGGAVTVTTVVKRAS